MKKSVRLMRIGRMNALSGSEQALAGHFLGLGHAHQFEQGGAEVAQAAAGSITMAGTGLVVWGVKGSPVS